MLVGENLRPVWKSSAGKGQTDYQRLSSSPIVADGRVYAMDSETRVSAFDAKTGSRVWRVDLTNTGEDEGHVPGGLAYAQGRVFATTGFAQVVALEAATGAETYASRCRRRCAQRHGAPGWCSSSRSTTRSRSTPTPASRLRTYAGITNPPPFSAARRRPPTAASWWCRSRRANWSRCAPAAAACCGRTHRHRPAHRPISALSHIRAVR